MSLALANYGFSSAPLLGPALLPNNFEQNNQFNPTFNNLPNNGYQNGFNFGYGSQSSFNFNNDFNTFNLDNNWYQSAFNSNNGYSFQSTQNQQNNNGFKNNANYQNGFFNNNFQHNQAQNKNGDDKEESNDPQEKWKKEWEDHLEKVEEEEKKKKTERFQDIRRLIILMFPFIFFDKPTASYFASTELLSVALEKLGVHDATNMLVLLFVQCVDIVALSRGRFKLVEGYEVNWYQELYDNALTQLGISDLIRLGTQMMMPQSPKPEYEEKR